MLGPVVLKTRMFDASAYSRRDSQTALLWLLEFLCQMNGLYLRRNPSTPLLYNANVRYFYQPGKIAQSELAADAFKDIPQVRHDGQGDCEDLACWRVAELRFRGVKAHPWITWTDRGIGSTLYHVQVWHPDGRIEDPSASLGMHGGVMVRRPIFVK